MGLRRDCLNLKINPGLKALLSEGRDGASLCSIILVGILACVLISGCAAGLQPTSSASPTATTSAQGAIAQTLPGTTVNFNFSNFYTLSDPNASGCVGDARTYYDSFALTSNLTPSPLPANLNATSYGVTIQPAFIKNVSLDITDANASFVGESNSATCSFGTGTAAPPVSSCAVFDYGAIDGVPSNFGGSLVTVGGVGSVSAMYALSVNSLPASAAGTSLAPGISSSTTPISSWANVTPPSGSTGPQSLSGASAVYSFLIKKLMVFGGSTFLTGMNSGNPGAATYDTWIYNNQTQSWTGPIVNAVVSASLERTLSYNEATPATLLQFQKTDLGRALFGYSAIPGTAIAQLSTTGQVINGSSGSNIDTTDRIWTVGGYGPCLNGVCISSRRFNPTYGPEYMDGLSAKNSIRNYQGNDSQKASYPSQWIDSYPVQLASNSYPSNISIPYSGLSPALFRAPTGTPGTTEIATAINFGMVGLNNNRPPSGGGVGLGINLWNGTSSPSSITAPPYGSSNQAGTGYPLVAGGFYGYASPVGDLNTNANNQDSGDMQIGVKWFLSNPTPPFKFPANSGSFDQTAENYSSNFSSLSNFIDSGYYGATPIEWVHIQDGSAPSTTPWFGGGVLLPGIDLAVGTSPNLLPSAPATYLPVPTSALNNASNQVVYFGGADCRSYLASSTTCTYWPSPGNPGRYWIFGVDPAASGTYPTVVPMTGTVPTNAGLAAARGLDSQGNPLIVALGGMNQPGQTDTSGKIYYLYKNSGTTPESPAWGSVVPLGGPSGLANASLVFSHVTGKFYLFGGYSSSQLGAVSDIWELSITSAGCGKATTASCTFAWRALTATTGLTCYPNCPPPRRSHRMAEANYNYFNPPFEPTCTSSQRPCSFGLFMQGGTADGISYFADRWMFDPTANQGGGHWQQVNEFPPRTLAASAPIDYTDNDTGQSHHRALLFGGETGMQVPQRSSGSFVPPTLGDTWIYDFDNSSWNLVQLLGTRYDSAAYSSGILSNTSISEFDARASAPVTDPLTQTLAPPPSSGGVMITRTLSRTNHLVTDTPTQLTIPQVFYFGGRKKDGSFQLLNSVYKFCVGSPGEKPYPTSQLGTAVPAPDDASCDAYDATDNPAAVGPLHFYAGRWLLKSPTGTGVDPTVTGSYLGAATYDTLHDLILLFGGISPAGSSSSYPASSIAITDGTHQTVLDGIYEFTPPSSVSVSSTALNGTWAKIPTCSGSLSPSARYGHSLAFDAHSSSVILTGGYDHNGVLLTQTLNYADSTSQQIPEVWTAYRVQQATSSGFPAMNIPAITTGSFPCYYWNLVTVFGNTDQLAGQTPPTQLAEAANVFIPSTGYNSGYYTLTDSSCTSSGPIYSTDPTISKLLVGGIYFDIDRSTLGPTENLVLHLTFIPLGPNSTSPDNEPLGVADTAYFRVHLIRTGETEAALQARPQPRVLDYSSTAQYPEVVQNLAVFAPSDGQIRQEEVFLPISIDPTIDRVRVERYSGSAILIDATLLRTGFLPSS